MVFAGERHCRGRLGTAEKPQPRRADHRDAGECCSANCKWTATRTIWRQSVFDNRFVGTELTHRQPGPSRRLHSAGDTATTQRLQKISSSVWCRCAAIRERPRYATPEPKGNLHARC